MAFIFSLRAQAACDMYSMAHAIFSSAALDTDAYAIVSEVASAGPEWEGQKIDSELRWNVQRKLAQYRYQQSARDYAVRNGQPTFDLNEQSASWRAQEWSARNCGRAQHKRYWRRKELRAIMARIDELAADAKRARIARITAQDTG